MVTQVIDSLCSFKIRLSIKILIIYWYLLLNYRAYNWITNKVCNLMGKESILQHKQRKAIVLLWGPWCIMGSQTLCQLLGRGSELVCVKSCVRLALLSWRTLHLWQEAVRVEWYKWWHELWWKDGGVCGRLVLLLRDVIHSPAHTTHHTTLLHPHSFTSSVQAVSLTCIYNDAVSHSRHGRFISVKCREWWWVQGSIALWQAGPPHLARLPHHSCPPNPPLALYVYVYKLYISWNPRMASGPAATSV